LEAEIAAWKNCEAALYFATGYQANVTVLQTVLQKEDWVFCDRLNHASLVDGCRLSGARWMRYKHLDLEHLERLLKKAPENVRKWIVTDSVFSMDGDLADLNGLADLADRHKASLYVDEAHASGLYGNRHSGLCEAQGVSNRVALQMGTFSKAMGGSGAYVAGKRVLIDYLINKARGFIYSTAPSPSVIAAALASIRLLNEHADPVQRLWRNVRFLQAEFIQAGLRKESDPPLQSPIVPILTGSEAATLALGEALLNQGFYLHPIRPPSVPPGECRLRLSLNADHTHRQIADMLQALKSVRRFLIEAEVQPGAES
jgi:8-amino-7-oxononanoate synthase